MNDNIENYLRIGTDYYKKISFPTTNDLVIRLQKWNLSNLRLDFEKNDIDLIPKYDAFCNIPDHLNYKRVIENCYNQYEPITHKPKEGDWCNTKMFLEHIFEEHYTIGLDYLTILFKYPTQCLPILCLVSTERKTGKSTFIYWLKTIFGFNMTLNSKEEFRSKFNSDWAGKLLIAVEETLLDKAEDSERIKQLSTGKNTKEESKGVNKVEVEFFGKFILCSNNETSFIKLDKYETRYWVRKIKNTVKEDCNLHQKLKKEIPAFLHFLNTREITHPQVTRTWFNESLLNTKALELLKNGNKPVLEKEISQIVIDLMIEFDLHEIEFTNRELVNLLKDSGFRISTSRLSEVLKNEFELTPSSPKAYQSYYWSGNLEAKHRSTESKKGRVYTFNIKEMEELHKC